MNVIVKSSLALIFLLLGVDMCRAGWDVISFDAFKINVYEDEGESGFEERIRKSLGETKDKFKEQATEALVAALKTGAGLIPYIGKIISPIIPLLAQISRDEKDWRGPLSKAIADETKRTIAKTLSTTIIGPGIEAIINSIRYLNDPEVSKRMSKETIVYNIHFELEKVLGSFSNENSIFREYPLPVTRLLMMLAEFVFVFDPILQAIFPALEKIYCVSCVLNTILLDYRPLIVNARLDAVELQCSDAMNCEIPRVDAKLREYNPNGYTLRYEACVKSSENCSNSYCITDEMNNRGYRYIESPYLACILNYLLVVRARVERELALPMDMVKSRSDKLAYNPKQKTGR